MLKKNLLKLISIFIDNFFSAYEVLSDPQKKQMYDQTGSTE